MARLGVIKTSAALGGDRDMGQGMEERGPVTTQTWRQNMTQNMGKYGTNIIMLHDIFIILYDLNLPIPPKYTLNLFPGKTMHSGGRLY